MVRAMPVTSWRARGFLLVTVLTGALAACGEDPFVGPPVSAPFAAVAAGVLHTCAVTTTGRLYCWGWNRDGQLGDGSTSDRAVPVLVDASLTFVMASGGGAHTCGVTSTTAYCWGFNLSGQLG